MSSSSSFSTPIDIAKLSQNQNQGQFLNEIGRTGIKRFGGVIQDEFLSQLRGRDGIRVYAEMRDNDEIIGAGTHAMEQVLLSPSWYVEPASNNNIDLNAAEFVKTCMIDMSHDWQSFINEILSYWTFGWSYFEVVYKLRKGRNRDSRLNSQFNDGLVGWRKIAIRKQESLHEWELDDNGGISGLWQSAAPTYEHVFIPIEKSILFRTKLNGNNPEGRSIYRNAYKSYYFKKAIQEFEAIGIEKDLIGFPVIKLPQGIDLDSPKHASLRTHLNKLLYSLRRDEQEGIALPFEWEIQLLGGGGQSRRQFDVDKIINRYDKRIAATMLVQFIMLGMDRVGSFALSKNQNDLFLLAVQGYLTNIASTLNKHEIPRLMRLNAKFSSLEKYPQFVPGKITRIELEPLSLFIERLAKNGLISADMNVDGATLVEQLLRIADLSPAITRESGVLNRQKKIDTKAKVKSDADVDVNVNANANPKGDKADGNTNSS